MRIVDQYASNLGSLFTGPLPAVRAALKRFPNIAEPGVDPILLFARKSPVAAVPSNCPHVLVRIAHGLERENYGVNYREAQMLIQSELPEQFHFRQRAYSSSRCTVRDLQAKTQMRPLSAPRGLRVCSRCQPRRTPVQPIARIHGSQIHHVLSR